MTALAVTSSTELPGCLMLSSAHDEQLGGQRAYRLQRAVRG